MKWLIVTNSPKENNTTLIMDLLNRHNAKSQLLILKSKENESTSIFEDDFLSSVKDFSHLIILDSQNAFNSPIVLFLAGYMAGKQLQVFISGSQNFKSDLFPSFKTYATTDEICAFLEEHFDEYRADEKKHLAHMQLFERGIPFTPDCFSFHIAKNNQDECQMFLEAGMDVNARDSAGTPMISMATRHERKEMIDWLVKNGADINVVSEDRGYSPIMDAVWKSNYDIAKYFVNKGAHLDTVSRDGQPVLVLAVGTGNEKICELLVSNGANPSMKDDMGMSALEYARLFKKDKLVSIFEKYIK